MLDSLGFASTFAFPPLNSASYTQFIHSLQTGSGFIMVRLAGPTMAVLLEFIGVLCHLGLQSESKFGFGMFKIPNDSTCP
jgi:hypothetical protein